MRSASLERYDITDHGSLFIAKEKPKTETIHPKTIPVCSPLNMPRLDCKYETRTKTKWCRFTNWLKELPWQSADYRTAYAKKYHGQREQLTEWEREAKAAGYETRLEASTVSYLATLFIWTELALNLFGEDGVSHPSEG